MKLRRPGSSLTKSRRRRLRKERPRTWFVRSSFAFYARTDASPANRNIAQQSISGRPGRWPAIAPDRSTVQIRCDERPQNLLQRRALFAAVRLARFKVDPAFVETVDHPNPRHRVLHALRAKHCPPPPTWNRLRTHRMLQPSAKTSSNIISLVTPRTFEFNNPDSRPGFTKE